MSDIRAEAGPNHSTKLAFERVRDWLRRREVRDTKLEEDLKKVELGLKALAEREPTRAEMISALGDDVVVFFDGWTVRRCHECAAPVAGGPTRCPKCVGRIWYIDEEEGIVRGQVEALDLSGEKVILFRPEKECRVEELQGAVDLIREAAGRMVPVVALQPGDQLNSYDRDRLIDEIDEVLAMNRYLDGFQHKSDEELDEYARRLEQEKERREDRFKAPGNYILREGDPDKFGEYGDIFSADDLREIQNNLGGDLRRSPDGRLELHTDTEVRRTKVDEGGAEDLDIEDVIPEDGKISSW